MGISLQTIPLYNKRLAHKQIVSIVTIRFCLLSNHLFSLHSFIIMKKSKAFDLFSFKAPSIHDSVDSKNPHPPPQQTKSKHVTFDLASELKLPLSHKKQSSPKNNRNPIPSATYSSFKAQPYQLPKYEYRIDKINALISKQENIHSKILNLDKQLEDNIRRRQELEDRIRKQKELTQPQVKQQMSRIDETTKLLQSHDIEAQAQRLAIISQKKNQYIQQPQSHRNNYIKVQNLSESSASSFRPKQKSKEILDTKELVQLAHKLTFPEMPTQKILDACHKRLLLLDSKHHHSDLVYLLMICNYHQDNHETVLKLLGQIILFKKFNPMSFWVAAESAFTIEDYDKCNKLVDLAIEKLDQRLLSRLLYLKSYSLVESLRFTQGLVCYNQLISIKQNVPEYRLQRAVLYSKMGFHEYAEQDFKDYVRLKPDWSQVLETEYEKEKSELKRERLRFLRSSLDRVVHSKDI